MREFNRNEWMFRFYDFLLARVLTAIYADEIKNILLFLIGSDTNR